MLNIAYHLPQYDKFLSDLWLILCKNSLKKRSYSKIHLRPMFRPYSNQPTNSLCKSFEKSLTWVAGKRYS